MAQSTSQSSSRFKSLPPKQARADSEENSSEDEAVQEKRRGRGKDKEYNSWKTFQSLKEYETWWSTEKVNWSQHNSYDGVNYVVERWKCKKARQKGYSCPATVHTVFPHDDDSVQVFVSTVQHEHRATDVSKINPLSSEVKLFIKDKLEINLQPSRIHVLLVEKFKDTLEKFPTLQQVQNYAQRVRDALSSGPFTDEQLRQYCLSKIYQPDDPDEPYVVGWKYKSNEAFYVLWSTANLLQRQLNSPFIQCDATFCLNWQAYPVQVLGYSDLGRRFVPTLLGIGPSENTAFYQDVFDKLISFDYRPRVVLGDGHAGLSKAVVQSFPEAIRAMCFAHMIRRCDAHLRSVPKDIRQSIRDDITTLRYARSKEEFLRVSDQMLQSWPEDEPTVEVFAKYFHETWVDSAECNWYEGSSPTVTTNNGLEATNRTIKQAHTLRKKLPFDVFLKVVERMDDADFPSVEPDTFRSAYELVTQARRTIKLNDTELYVVESSTNKCDSDDELHQKYEKCVSDAESWNAFKDTRFMVNIVKVSDQEGHRHFVCSCRDGSRKRPCKHSTYVMCRDEVALLEYPADARSKPLQQLGKKRGRPTGPSGGRPALAQKQSRHAVN